MASEKLDQYEFTYKMNPTLAKVFFGYLQHVENTDPQSIMEGSHGAEGIAMSIFNICETKAKRLQKMQNDMVTSLPDYALIHRIENA